MSFLRRKLPGLLLPVVLLTTVPTRVLADAAAKVTAGPPKPLAHTLTGEAKKDYEAARLVYQNGDYEGALAKFKHAFELSADVRLLWNMAACEKNLRHYVRGLRLMERYLEKGGALLTDDDRAQAAKFIAAVKELVAELTIVCDQPGARVLIDDEEMGVTPLPASVLVDMGLRRVRVVKSGFKESARSEQIAGGSKASVTIKLERESHEAKLSVIAREGEAIVVDGKAMGRTVWSGVLAGGAHVIEVSAPEKKTRRIELSLKDGENRSVHVELDANPSGGPVWPWIAAGGVAATGIVVLGYFLLRPAPKTPAPTDGTLGHYPLP